MDGDEVLTHHCHGQDTADQAVFGDSCGAFLGFGERCRRRRRASCCGADRAVSTDRANFAVSADAVDVDGVLDMVGFIGQAADHPLCQ